MKKLIYLSFYTVFFCALQLQSQELNYSIFTIPKDLKENANAVVRDYSLEITIEDIDKMVVRKKMV